MFRVQISTSITSPRLKQLCKNTEDSYLVNPFKILNFDGGGDLFPFFSIDNLNAQIWSVQDKLGEYQFNFVSNLVLI